MSEECWRGKALLKQLPTRWKLGRRDALTRLDECIASLRYVESSCVPPTYMVHELQQIGQKLGFRQNSRGYLRHMAQKAVHSEGNILECGSGLSTLLLSVTAGRQGHIVDCFEHDAIAQKRLCCLLERYHLQNVRVHHTPIRSYGDFDWYQLPRTKLAEQFQLVICDGPSRHLTDSGRYGLFPVMRDQLNSQCRVIMDDSNKRIDRHVIHRWRKEQQIEVQSYGRFLQFAEIVCV